MIKENGVNEDQGPTTPDWLVEQEREYWDRVMKDGGKVRGMMDNAKGGEEGGAEP